jgi:IclR family KDG regulon transcriptional repressor
MTEREHTAPAAVKSAARVMTILDLLSDRGAMTFSEIAAELELPKSSAHSLLATMTDRGYLEHDVAARTYALGIRVWQLARSRSDIDDLRLLLSPLMDRLGAETTETVQLARLEGSDAVYLAITEAMHPMKLYSAVGSRLPAHVSAVGKVLLAALDPADARARLTRALPLQAFTKHTITELDLVMIELERVRRRGYATDQEESTIGLRCVAMPILDRDGRTIAAMSVSIPTPRWSRDIATNAREALAATTARAHDLLAGQFAKRRT